MDFSNIYIRCYVLVMVSTYLGDFRGLGSPLAGVFDN